MACVTQQQSSRARQVYQYVQNSDSWIPLPDLPNSDIPQQCAVAGSLIFALGTSAHLYAFTNDAWSAMGQYTCVSMSGNTNYLGFIDLQNNAWRYDVASGNTVATNSGGTNNWIAQLSTGDQYIIGSDNSLYYCDNTQSPGVVTKLQDLVVAAYTSDTDGVYYTDNTAVTYRLNGTPAANNNTWTALPPLPSAT